MPFATGSQTQLTYVMESSWGLTPVSPSMIVLPVSSARMRRETGEYAVPTLRGDRQVDTYLHGDQSARLDIEFVLRRADFLDILAMALWGSWASNVLAGGTTRKSATFELMHTDIGRYQQLVGGVCESLTIAAQNAGPLMCKASFVGRTYGLSSTSLDSTPTPAALHAPYVHNGQDLLDGGTPIKATRWDLTIQNNLLDPRIVSSRIPADIGGGRQKVTFSIDALFENATLANKFLNESNLIPTFAAVDAAAKGFYASIGQARLLSEEASVEGEGVVTQKFKAQALYSAGIGGTSISIFVDP